LQTKPLRVTDPRSVFKSGHCLFSSPLDSHFDFWLYCPISGQSYDTCVNLPGSGFGSPVTARRSRLAGHGSPVTARRFSGEGRGGRFLQFSSFFWSAAPAAGNVPQSKTSRYFPDSRHSFPKTNRNFPSRHRSLAASNGSFAKSSRPWTERSRSFWESNRYFPSGNRCFPAFFRQNPLFLAKSPVFTGFGVVSGGAASRQPFSNLSQVHRPLNINLKTQKHIKT
jgi:hypothetical protein